ncbi:hypothetical protein SAMN05518669_13514 [Variovorax sp. YR634]|uniref:hypothetical protein n=1 Tax=Variovorax sp. YR634 TaxID=1884385 RepID=UPI00089448FD|nr:hypothetical protein [Variovorax sp. YR634]SDZ43299.1 hypothetical protein SAMN05518669_13514 [Variovorax sp. YR634]
MLVLKSSDGSLPPALKEEYLNVVSSWFLEEWRATEDDMVRDTDTPYTRGTTRFGRQKQRITLEYLSGLHPWLKVENNGLDIVFSICGIPCRFSNDDADSPKKRAVLEVHQFQIPLLEEAEPGEAARFVFVIDQGADEMSEPRVVLLGFSQSGQEVCRWTSGGIFRKIGEAKPSMPASVEIKKPLITPKRRPAADDGAEASAGP